MFFLHCNRHPQLQVILLEGNKAPVGAPPASGRRKLAEENYFPWWVPAWWYRDQLNLYYQHKTEQLNREEGEYFS